MENLQFSLVRKVSVHISPIRGHRYQISSLFEIPIVLLKPKIFSFMSEILVNFGKIDDFTYVIQSIPHLLIAKWCF